MIDINVPRIDMTKKPMMRAFQLSEGHAESFVTAPIASPTGLLDSSATKGSSASLKGHISPQLQASPMTMQHHEFDERSLGIEEHLDPEEK